MEELKSKTMEVINQVNQDWVNEIKSAENEERGIDLSELMGKYSANIGKLDQYFREARARLVNNKKKFLG